MAAASERLNTILDFMASRAFRLVHGDYHAKQMFFPTNAGGQFTVIDWQFPFVEHTLLSDYLIGLNSLGVVNYDSSELEADYRLGLAISQLIMSIAHGDTDERLLEEECGKLGVDWRDAMLPRTQRASEDWEVLAFIKSL